MKLFFSVIRNFNTLTHIHIHMILMCSVLCSVFGMEISCHPFFVVASIKWKRWDTEDRHQKKNSSINWIPYRMIFYIFQYVLHLDFCWKNQCFWRNLLFVLFLSLSLSIILFLFLSFYCLYLSFFLTYTHSLSFSFARSLVRSIYYFFLFVYFFSFLICTPFFITRF